MNNASKSFVQPFALALRDELKDTDIAIASLMPGATEIERAGMEDTKWAPARRTTRPKSRVRDSMP